MNGLPTTIRLLDPPLNEFLPHTDEEMQAVADAAGVSLRQVQIRKAELDEANPMLGHRGCRPCRHLSRDLRNAGTRHL